MTYNLKSVSLPRLTGLPLRLVASLLQTSPIKGPLSAKLIKDAGFDRLKNITLNCGPTPDPLMGFRNFSSAGPQLDMAETLQTNNQTRSSALAPTIRDYVEAYREQSASPVEVAEHILAAVETFDKGPQPLRLFIAQERQDIIKQATASAERYRQDKPLSILDGVPVAIKDELDQVPYPTTVGTRFMGKHQAAHDATPVARLREMGTLLIGKTNMHEIGIGVTGFNQHHGTARNPHNRAHYPGGSSSGSAAAVAAGLCPIALGADGGGSIRIPAAFCGVVGLKATYGRISEYGAAPLCWSVAHVGPLGGSATDTAIAYAAIAGSDSKDRTSNHQPQPHLADFSNDNLNDIRIGVYPEWFEHADETIVKSCRESLKVLTQQGATIKEITIPDLDSMRLAHAITISSEMLTNMTPHLATGPNPFGFDVQLNLALASAFGNVDYIKAQQIRTQALNDFQDVLQGVDAIVTPSTGISAPPIGQDVAANGESDLSVLTEIMRFAVQANLTGLPAISIPVGFDPAGLPIGMQCIGRPWEEHLLLRLARIIESKTEQRCPSSFANPLTGQMISSS